MPEIACPLLRGKPLGQSRPNSEGREVSPGHPWHLFLPRMPLNASAITCESAQSVDRFSRVAGCLGARALRAAAFVVEALLRKAPHGARPAQRSISAPWRARAGCPPGAAAQASCILDAHHACTSRLRWSGVMTQEVPQLRACRWSRAPSTLCSSPRWRSDGR